MTSECPKCGHVGRMRRVMSNGVPMWVYELRTIVTSRRPIFGGLLERGVWRADAKINRFLAEGWIEPVGHEGFRATAEGRRVYAELAERYNIRPRASAGEAAKEG